MEKILQTACILMVAFFVAITVGSVAYQDAYAGGGVNHKVTVKNNTELDFTVELWVSKYINKEYSMVTIDPGQTHTFQTGALCPSGLYGRAFIFGEIGQVVEKDVNFYYHIFGYKVSDPALFSAGCWSSSWLIVKEGEDYKFKKN